MCSDRHALSLIVLFLALAQVWSKFKGEWTDCGRSLPNRSLEIRKVDISPMPVVLPGKFTVNVEAESLRPLDDIYINATITRQTALFFSFFTVPLDIPCFDGVGSCDYDMCQVMKDNKYDTEGCPKALAAHGLPCTCPLPAMNATMVNQEFEVKSIPDILDFIKDGEYTVKAVMRHGQNSTEPAGCFEINFTLASPDDPTGSGTNEDPVGK